MGIVKKNRQQIRRKTLRLYTSFAQQKNPFIYRDDIASEKGWLEEI